MSATHSKTGAVGKSGVHPYTPVRYAPVRNASGRGAGPPTNDAAVPLRHVQGLDLSGAEHAKRGVLEALDGLRVPVEDSAAVGRDEGACAREHLVDPGVQQWTGRDLQSGLLEHLARETPFLSSSGKGMAPCAGAASEK